ncbi:MAG: flagellar filament capping protein FliD [Firmicutes bacterium]|nr:flagellar filament capping protein FliD [Bacillota bacterium]
MSIYFSGLASGIDIDGLIEGLMAIERRPVVLLQDRKNALQLEKDAWRDINSRLNNLQDRVADLKLASAFLSRTVQSSDETVVKATANRDAVLGRYQITVEQVAKSQRVASKSFDVEVTDSLGISGTLELTVRPKDSTDPSEETTFQITIGTGDSLVAIRDAINEAAAGVTATIIDGRLVLTTDETGFEIVASDETGVWQDLGMTVVQEAQSARLVVDGLSIERRSNTVDDVIEGVTLTLYDTGTAQIDVQHDAAAAVDRVRAFVDQYNSVQSFISEKAGKGGVLQGDGLLVRIQSGLRQSATAAVDAGSDALFNQLAQIGVTVDRYGTMTLDEAKLREALAESPEAVWRLFAGTKEEDGFDGVAVRLGERLSGWLESGSGPLVSRQQMLDQRMDDIDDSIERMEMRLEMREESLRRQFLAMEQALAALQAQSSWLSLQLQQLSAFSGYQSSGRS